MKSKVPMSSRGLSYKLLVTYAMMYVVPMMYLLYAINGVLQDFKIAAPPSSPAILVLALAIATGLVMSIAAFLLMYRSVKPIQDASRKAESFLEEMNGDRFDMPTSQDEVERISHFISAMITELRYKINDVDRYAQQLDDAHMKLIQLALKDSLTGLYNQTYINERLSSEITRAREYNRSVSVLLVDMDDFKTYNDTYGHIMGDKTLKEIAHVIAGNIRPIDIPARHGGEDFLIILPEAGRREGHKIAEKIRMAIAEHKFITDSPGKTANLTASVGMAVYPDNRGTSEAIISATESCLYEAKKAGKNRTWPQQSDTTIVTTITKNG